MGALSDYMQKKWGVRSRSIENPVTRTAAAGKTLILKNNPDRMMFVVINYDTALMRVAPSIDVAANWGIPLDPSGGFAAITADEDGELVGYEWYVYSAAGATNAVYVLETEAA